MVRHLHWLNIAVFISGCGVSVVDNFTPNADMRIIASELFPDIDFNAVLFGTGTIANPKYVGVCENDLRRITVDFNAWNEYSRIQREIILTHEIGHCVFNREHNDLHTLFNASCPDSIMQTSMMPQSCWIFHKEYYLMELRQ